MKMMFEKVKECPLCDGDRFGFAFIGVIEEQEAKVTGMDDLYYAKCGCGAIFHEWMMDDETLREFYTGGTYRESSWHDSAVMIRSNVEEEIIRAQKLARYLNGHKRCLDIGSSTGVLLKVMQADGAEVIGVEPNENFRKVCNENVVADISEVEGRFDFITLIHVLEHLARPKDMLNTIRDLLTDNGKLLIEIPIGDYSISHPITFTKKTFLKVLRDTGYRVEKLHGGKHMTALVRKGE